MQEIYDGKTVTEDELHEILNTMDEQTVLVVMLPGESIGKNEEERQCDSI